MKLLLVLLAMSAPCVARIGDTYEELVKRFGEPVGGMKVQRGHQHEFRQQSPGYPKPIRVTALLVDGKCAAENYRGIDEVGALALMRALKLAPWIKAKSEKGAVWQSGSTFAVIEGNALTITTKEGRGE